MLERTKGLAKPAYLSGLAKDSPGVGATLHSQGQPETGA